MPRPSPNDLARADAEESKLWQQLEESLPPPLVLSPEIRSGPTREQLRHRLEEAIAAGAWDRHRSLVFECAHSGAHVAAELLTLADEPIELEVLP